MSPKVLGRPQSVFSAKNGFEIRKTDYKNPRQRTPSQDRMNQLKQIHSEQPFFLVDDEAYERMMNKLKSGEKFVKTYLGVCPHPKKQDCKCEYFNNYLDEDGDMVRNVNGTIKPVLSLTILKNTMRKLMSKM
jgi:hypothetical protein